MAESDPRLDTATQPQIDACRLIDEFQARPAIFVWQVFDKAPFCAALRDRVFTPGLIQQGSAGLCGPASTLFDLAFRDPVAYVKFVISLYETGQANLGSLPIKPKRTLTARTIPWGVPEVDWIPMASIRSSENHFLRYVTDKDAFRGITLPHEIVSWLKALGYTNVVNKTNLLFDVRWKVAEQAAEHYANGDRVILFINGKMLYDNRMTRGSLVPNHWVALTGPLNYDSSQVWFSVFTWGEGNRAVPSPSSTLTRKDFLDNFYGFVAGSI